MDAVDFFNAYDREQQKRLKELPVCDDCGQPIQEYFFEIHGDVICPDCMEAYRRDI